MLVGCIIGFTLASLVLADSEYGGCRCARETALEMRSQYTCPRACINIYSPVCGFNPCKDDEEAFKTFDSKCRQESTVCHGPGQYYYYIYNTTCGSRY